jgi:hypothetical protein
MSGHFEQAYTSSDQDGITYIQYIQPDNVNVIIPNQFLSGMKEEYLEDDNRGGGTEVLESVINMSKKHKMKTESLSKELVQINPDGKPKGRKRAVADQTREIRKIRANTNQPYINSKGNEVKAKEFDESFHCGCPKKCTEQISVKTRKQIFNIFWGIGTYEGRCAFLNSCVNELPKKKQYTKAATSRRKNTRKYYLKGVEVCKIAFTKTLRISNSRVDVCLQKMESENFTDERGKNRIGHGFSEEMKEGVINHIKNNFTNESSLRGLWNCYQATHPEQQVSESYYKSKFDYYFLKI